MTTESESPARGPDGKFLPSGEADQADTNDDTATVPDETQHDQVDDRSLEEEYRTLIDENKTLKKHLRAAARELEEKQATIDESKPTHDVSARLFTKPAQVHEWFGDQALRDLAEEKLVDENRQRRRRDLSPITYTEDEWTAAVEQVVEELLADRVLNGAPEDGPLTRTLKMWNPKDNSIRQIPYEGQFNNVAGSLADGLVLYERKGFKRIEPFLCPAGGCYFEASIVESGKDEGKWRYEGYCSEDHYLRTEKRNVGDLPGVTSRASVTAPRG